MPILFAPPGEKENCAEHDNCDDADDDNGLGGNSRAALRHIPKCDRSASGDWGSAAAATAATKQLRSKCE
jgi:hypothetical protein